MQLNCSAPSVVQNSPQIIVTVKGSNFVQGSTVGVSISVAGQPLGLVTLFVDQSTLTATLTANQLTVA